MDFFLSVADAVAWLVRAKRGREKDDKFTPRQKIMIGLALVFGPVAVAVLSLFGLLRLAR